MVVSKIAKIAIAVAAVGAAVGTGYALSTNTKEDPKDLIARKVSWVNEWAKNNGGCKLRLVWRRAGDYIYPPDHLTWSGKIEGSDKYYLDDLRESLEGSNGKEVKAAENKDNCKKANGGELRLSRNPTQGWART